MQNLIVVPAYNEEGSIEKTLSTLSSLSDDYEILVVDDGSADSTFARASQAASESKVKIHVARLPVNCGIGVAVQTGYRFASSNGCYRYVIQCDADGQHPPSAIPALVNECESQNLDICVGSRFLNTNSNSFKSTFLRRIGVRFFSSMILLMCRQRFTDPTSGFRCVGPRVWRRFANLYPDDYPEVESLFWAARNHFSIGEIPVNMRSRFHGKSSITLPLSFYYMLKVSFAMLVDRSRHKEV